MTVRLRLARVAVGLGLVAVLAGGALWWTARAGSSAPKPVPVVDRGTVPTSSNASPVASAPPTLPASAPTTPTPRHGVPAGSQLRIPALHVDAPVGQVRAVDAVMQIPEDPHRVAWWRDGAAPGGSSGSAVIVGHINFHGVSGALAALPDLQPGDAVHLTEPGRPVLRYRVAAVRTYPKSSGIPAGVFDRSGAARLVLITCGGPFDASSGNYEDNIVAYAVPS